MPKLNVDELNFEPIELTLNGVLYTVKEVKQDMFDRVKEASKKAEEAVEEGEEEIGLIFEQLGIILNVDPKEFEGTDLRKATAAVRFLTDEITKQVEGKND